MRSMERRGGPRGHRAVPFLLVLVCVAAVTAVVAGPALAWEDWEHDTANRQSSCNLSGCHQDGANPANGTNAACVSCHTGYTTVNGKKCWDCHQPGNAPAVACSGSCHLFKLSGEDFSYPTVFSHGDSPHLGASGYGKACADCHQGGAHHDGSVTAEPSCAQCHDGTLAKSPPASHNDGNHVQCESCHDGMTIPAGGDCAACHVDNAGSGAPQITFTNDLTCGDASCHAKVKNHAGTPIADAPCTTCHTAHYEALGTCTKCHASPETFHHGTTTAIPLAQCGRCHDGGIAGIPPAHQVYSTDCATCHTGMQKPSGECSSCHVGNPTSGATQITYSNDLTCADPGCHAKVKNHEGTPIAQAACTACHEPPHYASLGTCTKCHPDPESFHHTTAEAIPLTQCATCHDGGIAAPPSGHTTYGTNCVSCHNGMDHPSGDCAACHVGNPSSGAPQITYSNTYSCADAACHAKVKNHQGTPIASAPCTTCHTAHYEDLGTCGTCHEDAESFHHATAEAIPLAQCVRCHNGDIAQAPSAHGEYGSDCASCHDGMNRPAADCAACHSKPQGTLPAVTSTNPLTCADASCHGKIKNHAGTPIRSACTTCHKTHYETLGDCTTCHTDPVRFHHGTTEAIPLAECAACHDGGIAAAPAGHESYGKKCADCHKGMDIPSGSCMECHSKAQGKVPAVKYTNSLSCGDVQCHGKVRNHKGTSIAAAPCTTCHKAHFEKLGTCTTCHDDPVQFHHGTSEAVALKECQTCHDDRQSHAGVRCDTCHDTMAPPPVPSTCQECHDKRQVGSATCTACHSKSSGMFGDKEQIHVKQPKIACGTCHEKPHYTDLGGCDSCHSSHVETHHAQATLVDTTLKFAVSHKKVKKGARVRVGGSLAGIAGPLAGQKVLLQSRTSAKKPFKTVSTLTTGDDGTFGRTLKVRVSTKYRVVWKAEGELGLSQRPAVKLASVRVKK